MFIDLHVHDKIYSRCSGLSLEDAVEAAKAAKLDAICITDHNTMQLKDHQFLKECKFPIFVGIEVTTVDGDMIAFGLPKTPNRPIHAQGLIDFTHKHNGFCYVAHPYRDYKSCLHDKIFELRNLQGIEVYNGGNEVYENLKALNAYQQFDNILALAGSDAHSKRAIGNYATYFENTVSSVEELVIELRAGRCKPAVKKEDGLFHIIDNF